MVFDWEKYDLDIIFFVNSGLIIVFCVFGLIMLSGIVVFFAFVRCESSSSITIASKTLRVGDLFY